MEFILKVNHLLFSSVKNNLNRKIKGTFFCYSRKVRVNDNQVICYMLGLYCFRNCRKRLQLNGQHYAGTGHRHLMSPDTHGDWMDPISCCMLWKIIHHETDSTHGVPFGSCNYQLLANVLQQHTISNYFSTDNYYTQSNSYLLILPQFRRMISNRFEQIELYFNSPAKQSIFAIRKKY